jgi:nicotinamidase-related amidase
MSGHEDLKQAFQDKAVAHLAIDVQGLYCDPTFPHFQTEKLLLDVQEGIDAIGSFAFLTRGIAETTWIYHTADLEEFQKRYCIRLFSSKEVNVARMRNMEERAYALIHPPGGDRVLGKKNHDAFDGTGLKEQLTAQGKSVLLLSGFFRDVCVYKTAVSGVREGFNVIVLDDLAPLCGSFKWHEENKIAKKYAEDGIGMIHSSHVMEIIRP